MMSSEASPENCKAETGPDAEKGQNTHLEELQKRNDELVQRLDESRRLIASLTETNNGLNRLLNRYALGLLSLIDIASVNLGGLQRGAMHAAEGR